MRVIIVGGGDIGRQLVRNVASGGDDEIVVIDLDRERCDAIAESEDVLVICGDATDPATLQEAQISEADALVAATDVDAINTVIAMLGRRYEVPKIIVRLSGTGLRPACEEIGVTEIVAPTIAAAARIQSLLYGHTVDFSYLAQRGLSLTEVSIGSAAEDQTIEQLDLPEGLLVVSVIRKDEAHLPHGGTRLEKGDSVLVLTDSRERLDRAREAFGEPQLSG